MDRRDIQNARTKAAKIAAAVLAGELSPVLGAIDLNGLRSSVDVPDNDPDFEAFMLIDSEVRWPANRAGSAILVC